MSKLKVGIYTKNSSTDMFACINTLIRAFLYVDLFSTVFTYSLRGPLNYSRLSLSRIPRDSLKYFEISVLRHIKFAELGEKLIFD